MRGYKHLLTSFVEVVVFLLSAFGGFLQRIAPPEQTGAPFAVGILSFLVLIVLLLVTALARTAPGARFRRAWIAAGVTAFALSIPPSVLYPRALRLYTWSYPPDKPIQRVRALDIDFTPRVREFLKNTAEQATPTVLGRNFELDEIWTKESLDRASTTLLVLYAWLILSLATAVFCLLEANIAEPARTGRTARQTRGAADGAH